MSADIIAKYMTMVKCDDTSPGNLHLNQRQRRALIAYGSKLAMGSNNFTCAYNCSGHGECYDGVCFCQVEYSGGACDNPNLRYFIAFSTVFYFICAISFLQLILCINSEFNRQKPRSLVRAFRITTQKALYFFICVATGIRGFYFSSSQNLIVNWAPSLMSAYYPVLLSGSSLVVCFWAEVFHLHDVSAERPGFLSKSFTGFVLFNVVTYSLLLAELILIQFGGVDDNDKSFFLSIFNSLYAILMLVVVIFFLIYGVEVYFKVRGAFIQGESCSANFSQLQQSRLGLISQAVLLLITVLFIFSDVFGVWWKDKVPILSRNTHEIMFRVVELGVALWFPCVLWNCIQPERLWILNPRRIIQKDRAKKENDIAFTEAEALCPSTSSYSAIRKSDTSASKPSLLECWICYDSERNDAGPLIQPCLCKGDVSAVHHDCLKKWLMESFSNPTEVQCKVCKQLYNVQRGDVWLPSGLTITHWFKTAALITIMCSAAGGAILMVKLFEHVYVRTISVGCCILVEYICLRILGVNILSAYHRAKFTAVRITGRKFMAASFDGQSKSNESQMVTVSENIIEEQLCTGCRFDEPVNNAANKPNETLTDIDHRFPRGSASKTETNATEETCA